MEDRKEAASQFFLTLAALDLVVKKLDGIEDKLEKRIASLSTEDAVEAFRKHVSEKHRQPRNYNYLLEQFESRFSGRNVCELFADEIHDFLTSRWGGCAASTFNKYKDRLSSFFEFCIIIVKRQGAPAFYNPCSLLDKNNQISDKPEQEYIDVETMQAFLDTFTEDHHWLWAAIMATGGLRVGELVKLRPEDVNGRILTLCRPKSGKKKEVAVIPQKVADALSEFISAHCADKRLPIWEGRLQNDAKDFLETGVDDFHRMKDHPEWKLIFNKAIDAMTKKVERPISRRAQWVDVKITPHSLRKFCATFWDRQDDRDMRRFVLRHSSVKGDIASVEANYVIMLDPQNAMLKQDDKMEWI